MSELIARTQMESFIEAIINGTTPPSDPNSRIEIYLAKIAGADIAIPDPVTAVDHYLAKLAGADVEIPDPVNRIDYWLAALCGEDVVTPEPIYPIELWLEEWNQGSGLPDSYVRQLGFSFNNNAYFEIPGFKLRGSDTVKVSFSVTKACNVWGCYQGASATDNYDYYASTSPGAKYLRYGDGTYRSDIPPGGEGMRYDSIITPTGTSGLPVDSTWEEQTFESANDLTVGTTSKTSTSSKLVGNIYDDFEVVGRLKLIPCRRKTDDSLGYYDTYSKSFYTPIGTGLVSLGDA